MPNTPSDQFGTAEYSKVGEGGCFRGCCPDQKTHFKSIQLGRVEKTEESKMEKRWSKDHDAYRRMRKNGVQPKALNGAAEIETRASTELEVKMGRFFETKQEQASARAGTEISQELGLTK